MQNIHASLKLNKGLLKVALKVRAEELTSAKLKKPKKEKVLSDVQILQIRALKEFAGWKAPKIAEHFGIDISKVYKIVSYEQRSKLIPKRTDLPF